MASNVIFFGWHRSLPGRESLSGAHFQEFIKYLGERQAAGAIQSFEPVLLEPNGGRVEGFFLIRGEPARLAELADSPEWMQHVVRAMLHMDDTVIVRGVTGSAVGERLAMWMNAIPR
jgi:hypothetical protein